MNKQTEKEVRRLIAGFAKNVVNDFAEFLKLQMEERDYMGIKYKQGVFCDSDIESFANEFIIKRFGVEIEE